MLERPWEIEAPSLAISIAWGDVALHTAHLSPARSFFLGDSTADCVLPDSVVPAGRVPLILAERGAVYLVLHPAMDPEGTITAPGNRARTVADLARPGISDPSPDVPGAFLVKLAPGTTAALSLGDFTIAITLETKAAVAVAGHYHVSPRSIPFQLASAALHLAVLGVLALLMSPPTDYRDPPSDEQVYFIQQALMRIEEKELAEIESYGGESEPAYSTKPYRGWAVQTPLYWPGNTGPGARSPLEYAMFGAGTSGDDRYPSTSKPADPRQARRRDLLAENDVVGDDEVNAPIDPRADRYSTLPIDVDTAAYGEARRSLLHGAAPAPAAVRPEAFLNSFDYAYAAPPSGGATPFRVHLAAAPSPFAAGHHLLRVGVQGRRMDTWAQEIIARDVTIQVDFSPAAVRSYRLVGFENRGGRYDDAARYDRARSSKIGVGATVTAVYDVVLANTTSSPVTVRLRSTPPLAGSRPEERVFTMSPRDIAASFDAAPRSLRLAAAVAGFAEILRKSPHAAKWNLADVERIASAATGTDERDQELSSLIRAARSLDDVRPSRAWGGRVADASLLGF